VRRGEQESTDDVEGHKFENTIVEHRALTRPEIQQYRQEYSQKRRKKCYLP
jgi:hypothetical protein